MVHVRVEEGGDYKNSFVVEIPEELSSIAGVEADSLVTRLLESLQYNYFDGSILRCSKK